MKPLFLSIAIVGAISLWYSNAQADESRKYGSHARYSNHQSQHNTHSESRGHGWGRDGVGREFGHSQQQNGSNHSGSYRESRYQYEGGINNREREQRQYIARASRSGMLTGEERKALWSEQRAIEAKERAFRADGRLSREERSDLNNDLTLASRHIYNESHDSERRGERGDHGDRGDYRQNIGGSSQGGYADRGYHSRTYRH